MSETAGRPPQDDVTITIDADESRNGRAVHDTPPELEAMYGFDTKYATHVGN